MAPIAQQIAQMIDILPETDQALALELEAGEYVPESAINWG